MFPSHAFSSRLVEETNRGSVFCTVLLLAFVLFCTCAFLHLCFFALVFLLALVLFALVLVLALGPVLVLF